MKVRQWKVGPNHIYEKSEYVNLGVFKNYCGSFDKNIDIDENITEARKKAGMLFSADFDRRRMNPMVYILSFEDRSAFLRSFLEQNSGL